MAFPVERDGGVPQRREMSSARRTGGTGEGGGEAGMEKPTTDEVGSEDLVSPAVGRSKDAHDFLRTGGADAGAGADVDAGGGADAGAVEEETASEGASAVVSIDDVGTTEGGSGTSVGGDSTMEATTSTARSHDSDLDFT